MAKRSLGLSFELRFQRIQNINPSFDLARVAIAYHGKNRNRSIISKDTFEKALPTLFNIPVVGRFIPEEDDFGSHDLMIVTDDNGVVKSVENATVPFGVIPESANVGWEFITEKDGTENEYLVTDCLLWRRSYGYETLVSQDQWSQSMEIDVNDYEFDKEDFMVVKDMVFTALCILGKNVEPCFESASLQMNLGGQMSSYRSQYNLMVDDLKQLKADGVTFSLDCLSSKEGGYDCLFDEELRNSVLAEFGLTVEDITFDYSEMTEDEFRGKCSELAVQCAADDVGCVDTDDSDDGGNGEAATEGDDNAEFAAESEPEQQRFASSYMDKMEALRAALHPVDITENGKIVASVYYWLCDADDEYAYVNIETYNDSGCKQTKARCAYTYADGVATVSEFEEMVVRWLTLDEDKRLEQERTELAALRAFKQETEDAAHKAEVDTLVDSTFSTVKSTPEFIKLGDTIYSLTSEELTEKLYAIKGRYATTAAAADNSVVSIPIGDIKTNKNNSVYGELFSTYAKDNRVNK